MHTEVAKRLALVALVAAALASAALVRRTHAQLPALEVSPNGRFLQRPTSKPFFWLGDAAWSLYRLNPDELQHYFNDRRLKGFNVIQGPTLLQTVPNYAGHSNPDPGAPNEAWFAHIDTIVATAAAHGLYIAPALAWGTQAGDFTEKSAYDYGFYIGARYQNATNIAAFIVAGEFNHPQANVEIWDAVATGLQAGLAGNARLLTAHPRWYGVWGGQSSSGDLHALPWLSFNMLQSSLFGNCTNDPEHLHYLGTHNWMLIEQDWALAPAKPVLDGEATFEHASTLNSDCDFNPARWNAFGVRRRAYWSVFAGGFGHTYGCNGVTQFHMKGDPPAWGDPEDFWPVAMHYPGATQMGHLRKLMQSRPLELRLPGQDVLLSSPGLLVPAHIHATRDAGGRYAMVYVPQPNKTVTVDMDFISGKSQRMWWFAPATGQATLIGEFEDGDYAPNGAWTITTPSTGEDWVLVLDDASANFPAPGDVPFERPGDINRDGLTDVNDLLILIGAWGPCAAPPPAPCLPDQNGDGVVDVNDLLILIGGWGG